MPRSLHSVGEVIEMIIDSLNKHFVQPLLCPRHCARHSSDPSGFHCQKALVSACISPWCPLSSCISGLSLLSICENLASRWVLIIVFTPRSGWLIMTERRPSQGYLLFKEDEDDGASLWRNRRWQLSCHKHRNKIK